MRRLTSRYRVVAWIGFLALSVALTACTGATGAGGDEDGGPDTSAEEPEAGDEGQSTDSPEGGDEGEADLTAITVAATAPVPAGFPAYWLAEGYGFYEEEGLDVDLTSPTGSPPSLLLSGRLDIAGVQFDYIPQGAEEDRLKIFMHTDLMPWVLVTFEDSRIDEIADLQGETIGINEPDDEGEAQFLLASGGLFPGDYELVPVGEDTASLIAMERGEVAAFMGAFRGANTYLPDEASRPLRLLENPRGAFPGSGPMATVDFLEDNRDVAAAFGRALARAIIWQQENPELSAEVLLGMVPETAEDVEQMTLFLELANDWHSEPYEDDMLRIDEEEVSEYIDTWVELGFIEEPYDPSRIMTNDLYDDIFDFDVEAEQEQARNATSPPNG